MVCLFLAAAIWFVFGQTLHFEFVNYDDPAYIYQNPIITQGLHWHGIVWLFTHVNAGTWFPVTDLSHLLDWQLYGANAGGHHLTNVLLHTATSILLFLVLRKLTRAFWSAAFVAAVFAIHPLRVESVAWVVERKDVLSGLFFMLTLWAWTRYVQKRKLNAGRSNFTQDYFLAMTFFTLGLLSKSMLVTLPFVLLLLDYWPLNRWPAGENSAPGSRLKLRLGLILEKMPFLLLSAADCVVTVLTQKNAVLIAQSSTVFGRVGNALLAYVTYLDHLIYPVGLTVAYAHPDISPSLWRVGWAVALLAAISVGVLAGRRKHPYLVMGWLWYLGMLLPVIDIMQAAHNARADRYTYLPQIGVTILITWGAVELCTSLRHRRIVLGFAASVILASLLVDACIQTSYWQNSEALWTRALACKSENSFAYNTLGNVLAGQRKWMAAARDFERALQIEPDYVEAHVNLGVALAAQDKPDEAIRQFERALQLNPYSADAHYNLGDALVDQGKPEQAIPHFEQALQIRPGYAEARYDWGFALAIQGKWDAAIPQYEQALKLNLDKTDAQYMTAVALATQKKWAEAIALYEQVLQRRPDYAEARNNLGVALAGQGKLAEARQQFQQALTLATAQNNPTLAASVRLRLKSYPVELPQPQTP